MASFGRGWILIVALGLAVPLASDAGHIHDRRILLDGFLMGKTFSEITPAPLPDLLAWLKLAGEAGLVQVKSSADWLELALRDNREPDSVENIDYPRYVRARSAVELLLAIGDPSGDSYLTALVLRAKKRLLRALAYDLVARFGGPKYRLLSYRGLFDPSRAIQRDSISYLARIGDRRALSHLQALAKRDRSKRSKIIRMEVERAVAAIGTRDAIDNGGLRGGGQGRTTSGQ